MSGARFRGHRAIGGPLLALLCALGSVACGRPGQAGARSSEIDATSPGAVRWPGFGAEEEPKLGDADVEKVAVRLPHEKVPPVSAQNPVRGPANAKVTLQVFGDFECSFCVRVAPVLEDVEQRYAGRVRMVWRNYPLPMHERALPTARAGCFVFQQGGNDAFWRLHGMFYGPNADLSDKGLDRTARALSLDPGQLLEASRSPRFDAALEADVQAGNQAGIEGTPAVFINDYYLMGARFESEYAIVVERALREAG